MKRVYLGLAVIFIAISANAFTNINRSIGDYVIQDVGIPGQYILILSSDFSLSNCMDDENPCAFTILTDTVLPVPLTLTYILAHSEQFMPTRNISNQIVEGIYIQ